MPTSSSAIALFNSSFKYVKLAKLRFVWVIIQMEIYNEKLIRNVCGQLMKKGYMQCKPFPSRQRSRAKHGNFFVNTKVEVLKSGEIDSYCLSGTILRCTFVLTTKTNWTKNHPCRISTTDFPLFCLAEVDYRLSTIKKKGRLPGYIREVWENLGPYSDCLTSPACLQFSELQGR